jgi:hypothetical protein
MSIAWRFSINGTQVEEPIGWDAIQFKLQRDDQFSGLENMLSENIVYDGVGGALIKAAYETDGIDAPLVYLVEYSCDRITYVTRFTGILNCISYKEVNGVVTVKAEPSGFHRKVKNRLDVPVNLMSSTSIGGEAMSTIDPFDLGMHSKIILYESDFIQDPTRPQLDRAPGPGVGTGDTYAYPLIATLSDLQETTDTSTFEPAIDNPLLYSGAIYPPGVTLRTITIEGNLIFDITWYDIVVRLYLAAKDADGNPLETIELDDFLLDEINPQSESVNLTFSHSIDLPVDSYLYLYFEVTGEGSGGVNSLLIDFDANSTLSLSEESEYPSTTAKSYLLHEVFAKLAESMTDVQDSFKSDFFGRTNSSPRTYDTNGCGAWVAFTNGLNIRKMLDKNGNIFPITTSFNDLFESCNAEWNLGMRIEKDDTGKEFIRVEPKEYFYNLSSVITLSNVADIETVPAIDLIYNEFEVGYDKWNLNIGKVSGIDEFNSKRNYSVPMEKAKKKLSAMSKIIAAGYTIEQTRRQQYDVNTTADFETDNDLFFICTNIAPVTSSLYTTPPVSTLYEAGTVSERNENFTSIDNLLSPETAYNLRLSPARMAIKWWKTLAGALYYKAPATVKFISGTGNYQEEDQQTDSCNTYDEIIQQDQGLTSDNIIGTDVDPLYIPNYVNFQYPLTWENFLLLEANSEKVLQFSCNGTIRRGFIKTLEFEPNSDGDTARFKLIEAGGCISGEFNPDEFTIAFTIGEC